MSRYLLTPSLYSSWRYCATSDDSGEARQQFLSVLRREPVEPNENMLKGRQFEAHVQAACDYIHDAYDGARGPEYAQCVEDIAEIVRGGLWQERIYHNLHFRDHGDFLLFGKIDVVKGPWNFDIKYSVGRYEVGKYGKGIQHMAYPAGSGCPRFAYLISNGREWWREDYFYTPELYEEMRGRLLNMLDDIKRDREFADLYASRWKADRDGR